MEFNMPKEINSIIKVIGVGGGGSNAVNHMYNQGIERVDFVVCNTDKQALDISPVPLKIQLGTSLTEGRGAGAIPEIGKNAAVENIDEIKEILGNGTKMVFVTAGMGGGTGTGAAPVIAQVAKEMGILTVGIVTVPFNFEGRKRRQQAEEGLENMRKNVDTLLVINNERLTQITKNLSISNAFAQADNVLARAAKGIADVISVTGSINVDFNDVNTVMKDSGVAIMGSAMAEGEERAIESIQEAMNSPLLNDNNITGARYVLLNITYGDVEVTMNEISEITDYIQTEAGSTADVIWGHGYDPTLGDKLSVTLIATGFESNPITGFEKAPERRVVRLEDELKNEIVTPMSTPTESKTVPTPAMDEPFLKKAEVEENTFSNVVEVKQEIEFKAAPVTEIKAEQQSFELELEIETPSPIQSEMESRKEEIKFHNLDDEAPAINNQVGITKTAYSPEEQQRLANERMQRIQAYTAKLRKAEGIYDFESEPAYARREVKLNHENSSRESSVSRFGLSEDENGTSLRSNNSFLHDNVD